MLDADLAELYGVQTKILNKAVKRNLNRFPSDFMFQISEEEFENLRFHFGTSSWGGRRFYPYAFTEHGAVMLACILNSPIAVKASVQVVRAFVHLQKILSTHKNLAGKLEALEKKSEVHDADIERIFDLIRELRIPPEPKSKRRLGFRQ